MAKLVFKERVLPPEGHHLATLVRIDEEDNKFYDPKVDSPDRKKRYGWVFVYDDVPCMEIRAWSSPSLSTYKGKDSKALTIVETLLEKDLTDEDKRNFKGTDDLIGKKCYLDVIHVRSESTAEMTARIEKMSGQSGLPF